MPGNGSIGGGHSCTLRFEIDNGQTGPAKKDKGKWEFHDDDVADHTFCVKVTFPDGTVKSDWVSPSKKIVIEWPGTGCDPAKEPKEKS